MFLLHINLSDTYRQHIIATASKGAIILEKKQIGLVVHFAIQTWCRSILETNKHTHPCGPIVITDGLYLFLTDPPSLDLLTSCDETCFIKVYICLSRRCVPEVEQIFTSCFFYLYYLFSQLLRVAKAASFCRINLWT